MKTLYLIDGYAQFFRAYHAIRNPMTSPVTKEPTNMTFGFVGMLLKLLRAADPNLQNDGAPSYVAVALDVSGDTGTFRSQLYPEYKANRDAPPEDLFPQVERCLKMLEAIGVPLLGAEGFEADDVIATIASTYSERHPDVRVRIVSKDKDLKQLLGEGTPATEMYDIHTGALITAQTLADETGLRPAQVIDMLALMGDTVDNVPGVPGVGPKTAAQLIVEFGDLDAVIAEVTNDAPKKDWKIKGKRRENIAAFADKLPLSRELVALRHDVPVELDLDAASVGSLKLPELESIFRELGFGRYRDDLRELLGATDDTSFKPQTRGSPSSGFGGLFDQNESGAPEPADGTYHVVTTKKALDALVKKCQSAPVVAVDTETTALRPTRADLAGVCLAIEEGEGYYIPIRSPDPSTHLDESTVLDAMRPMLEDPSVPKVGHNLKYDMIVLARAGVDLRGFNQPDAEPGTVFGDTMIASYLSDASRSSHSLDALTQALLGRQNLSIKDLIGTGKNQKRFDEVPLDQAGPYAAEDADVTLRLANRMLPELRAMGLFDLYATLEMPLVRVLAALEQNGIAVDRAELDHQRERLEARITELRAQIEDEAMASVGRGFDPDSPKQLAGVLFNKPDAQDPGLGLRPLKKRKTGPSTDAEVLEKLDADPDIETPIPRLILDLRQLTKLVGTYLTSLADEIQDDGRIHASFNQTVAATGRLSSSDPNLQNIPIRSDLGREIRKAFVAPEGRVLVSADYSQIELRLLAHLSDDPALIEAFHAGEDIHRAVAAQIHGVSPDDVTREQRDGAKMVNFGIVYGITPFGLARRLDVSNAEAAEIIDGYKKRFAGITTFLAECVAQAQSKGYVETMMKRRRPIPEIDSNNPNRRALAERTAINTVVQGSAADLIKIAMVDLQARIEASSSLSPTGERAGVREPPPPSPLGGEGRGEGSPSDLGRGRPGSPDPALADTLMLLQIHDELVFEAPESAADDVRSIVVERMEAAMDLKVPLKVESAVSRDWFSGK